MSTSFPSSKDGAQRSVPIMLIGNKADLRDSASAEKQKCISAYLGEKLAMVRVCVCGGVSKMRQYHDSFQNWWQSLPYVVHCAEMVLIMCCTSSYIVHRAGDSPHACAVYCFGYNSYSCILYCAGHNLHLFVLRFFLNNIHL